MFNILILEDDKNQLRGLEEIFKNLDSTNYKIDTLKAEYLEEFFNKLSSKYYNFLSFDQNIPEKKDDEPTFFDIAIFNKIGRYNCLSFNAVYTAFPKWNYANALGLKNVKYYDKQLPLTEYKKIIENELKDYFKFIGTTNTPDRLNVFIKAIGRLPLPFGKIISNIVDCQESKEENKKKLGELVLYFLSIVVASVLDYKLENNDSETLLNFLEESSKELNGDSIAHKELKRLFNDSDFLSGLSKLINCKMKDDNLGYWIVFLQFFVAHIIAKKAILTRNPLGLEEVEMQRVGSSNRRVISFANRFSNKPPQSEAIFVFRDIEKKAEFIDISEYLKLELKDNRWEFTFFNKEKF